MPYGYLILRHGETEGTVAGIHQCRIDTPLTKKGKQQMIQLGKQIYALQKHGKIEKIDGIYYSPMGRTKKSLELVLENVLLDGNPPLIYTDKLLEHNMGDYDGMTTEQVEKIDPGFTQRRAKDRWNVCPPDGENYFMVQKRVVDFLGKTKGRQHNTIMIMAHKAVSKILIGTILALPRDKFYGIDMPCGGGYYIQKNKRLFKIQDNQIIPIEF